MVGTTIHQMVWYPICLVTLQEYDDPFYSNLAIFIMYLYVPYVGSINGVLLKKILVGKK